MVLIDTGSDRVPYLYAVMARQQGDRWVEGTLGSCPGWVPTDPIRAADEHSIGGCGGMQCLALEGVTSLMCP